MFVLNGTEANPVAKSRREGKQGEWEGWGVRTGEKKQEDELGGKIGYFVQLSHNIWRASASNLG